MIETAAIIGKGALGMLFGGIIDRNLGRNAVEYVMDDARFDRHAGEVTRINGEVRELRTIRASEAAPVDLVILAVKATGLSAALDLMPRLVGPQTRIVSLLNGISSEEKIAARFGWKNTVIAVAQGMDAVHMGSDLTYVHAGQICFGAAEGTDPAAVSDIAAFFDRAGIAYTVEADIKHRLWAKFMLNVGINQICMAYGGTYGSASEPGEQNRMFIAAMREVVAVGNAEGVPLTEDDLRSMAKLIAGLAPDGMPSMAQDRINKHPSEVAEFSGALIERAEKHGILVPANRYLNERIHEIEAAYVK